jgi:hypothetical protein
MNFLELELFSHTIAEYIALAPPVVVLGFLLGGVEAAAFHVLFGRGDRSTLWYVGLGQIGFWIGHFAADYIGSFFPPLGLLHAAEASIACVTLLYIADYVRN